MLKIEHLNVNVDEKRILDDFNLELKDGEIHCIMGPNGVGKSTICRTLCNDVNYTVTDGNIVFNGKNILELSTTEIARLGIMLISQSPIAIPGVTNAEMLRIALSERTQEQVNIFEFSKKVKEVCKKINLPESFLHREINVGMSGGERKKNELLHVWMLEPSVLVLDEIDSGLDVDALKVVASSLREYHEQTNCTFLIVTHNTKLLKILKPDYIHIMKNKKIVKTGDISLIDEIEKYGFSDNVEANALEVGKENE